MESDCGDLLEGPIPAAEQEERKETESMEEKPEASNPDSDSGAESPAAGVSSEPETKELDQDDESLGASNSRTKRRRDLRKRKKQQQLEQLEQVAAANSELQEDNEAVIIPASDAQEGPKPVCTGTQTESAEVPAAVTCYAQTHMTSLLTVGNGTQTDPVLSNTMDVQTDDSFLSRPPTASTAVQTLPIAMVEGSTQTEPLPLPEQRMKETQTELHVSGSPIIRSASLDSKRVGVTDSEWEPVHGSSTARYRSRARSSPGRTQIYETEALSRHLELEQKPLSLPESVVSSRLATDTGSNFLLQLLSSGTSGIVVLAALLFLVRALILRSHNWEGALPRLTDSMDVSTATKPEPFKQHFHGVLFQVVMLAGAVFCGAYLASFAGLSLGGGLSPMASMPSRLKKSFSDPALNQGFNQQEEDGLATADPRPSAAETAGAKAADTRQGFVSALKSWHFQQGGVGTMVFRG